MKKLFFGGILLLAILYIVLFLYWSNVSYIWQIAPRDWMYSILFTLITFLSIVAAFYISRVLNREEAAALQAEREKDVVRYIDSTLRYNFHQLVMLRDYRLAKYDTITMSNYYDFLSDIQNFSLDTGLWRLLETQYLPELIALDRVYAEKKEIAAHERFITTFKGFFAAIESEYYNSIVKPSKPIVVEDIARLYQEKLDNFKLQTDDGLLTKMVNQHVTMLNALQVLVTHYGVGEKNKNKKK